jgi:hypothetical protein
MSWRLWLAVMAGAVALVGLARRASSRGGTVTRLPRGARIGSIERCPIHGIAFDVEKEVCPRCAQPA